MAKENDKPMTREEVRQSALEDKFFQQLFGANALKKDPFKFGQVGMSAGAQNYADFMESEKADKIRKGIYAQRKDEQEKLGIAEEPSYPGGYDVTRYVVSTLDQSMKELPLGKLEESIKKTVSGLEFNVPKSLENLSYENIIENAVKQGKTNDKGQIDASKLSDDEKNVLGLYSLFREAYEETLARNLITNKGYLKGINEAIKKIEEQYKTK